MADMALEDSRGIRLGFLLISLIPLSLAIYGTVTGTAVIKNSKVYRAKNPFQYWFVLAVEYAMFAFLISFVILG
jgi:hypothetical protein